MTLKNLYLRAVAVIIIVVAVYGFAVPTLVSMRDSLCVFLGFFIGFVAPTALFSIVKPLFITKGKN